MMNFAIWHRFSIAGTLDLEMGHQAHDSREEPKIACGILRICLK